MAYDGEIVMKRDNRQCRLRYPGCLKHAATIVLHIPMFLGGTHTDTNARAACRPCAKELQEQRNRAANLFGERAA